MLIAISLAGGCDLVVKPTVYLIEAPARERREQEQAKEQHLVVANQLTRSARSYAISGDCAAVEAIAGHVRNFDLAYFRDVFVYDTIIVRHCPEEIFR